MSEQKTCEDCTYLKKTMSEQPCVDCDDYDRWSPLNFPAAVREAIEERGSVLATPPDTAKALADAHWSYVKEVLTTHCSPEAKAFIGEIGFHYKTAFVHGYKHGKEDS